MFIQDGTGSGFLVHVDGQNRLVSLAQSISMREVAATQGNAAYFFTTGLVTLTNAAESGLLYLKNLDPNRVLIIENIQINLGVSTGGPGKDVIIRIYTNPTSGTLLTAGTAISPGNANFGSTSPAQATLLLGAVGATIVSPATGLPFIFQDAERENVQVAGVLPVNTSAAMSVQPGTGNTSMTVTLAFGGFYISPDFL